MRLARAFAPLDRSTDVFGLALDVAAERHPTAQVRLDRPLALAPEAGLACSYERLAGVAEQVSGRLAALGAGRGDCVVVLVPNGLDVHLAMYGALRIGAVPALLSDQLAPAAVAHALDVLRPRIVLCGARLLERHHSAIEQARAAGTVVAVQEASAADLPRDVLRLEDVTPREGVARAPKRGSEPAIVIHSSGTTGTPKLVVHSERGARAIGVCGRYQSYARGLPIGPRDVVASCLTFTHVRAALGHQLALAHGCPLLLLTRPDAPELAERLGEQAPAIVETHPNVFMRWERCAEAPTRPFARTRIFVTTADTLHERTVRRLLAASDRRHVIFFEVYGMSEAGPATARIHHGRRTRQPRISRGRDVGRPIPGFSRVRIVDPATGRRLRWGGIGAIELATRGRLLTYAGEEERLRANLSGRWFRTGDVGSRTWSGRVRLHDRAVDLVPGIASCIVVEDMLLLRLEELEEVVLVRTDVDTAVPVVVTRSGAPIQAQAWAAATADLPVRLADPVLLAAEQVPQTATQKVRRFLLRELLAEESA